MLLRILQEELRKEEQQYSFRKYQMMMIRMKMNTCLLLQITVRRQNAQNRKVLLKLIRLLILKNCRIRHFQQKDTHIAGLRHCLRWRALIVVRPVENIQISTFLSLWKIQQIFLQYFIWEIRQKLLLLRLQTLSHIRFE